MWGQGWVRSGLSLLQPRFLVFSATEKVLRASGEVFGAPGSGEVFGEVFGAAGEVFALNLSSPCQGRPPPASSSEFNALWDSNDFKKQINIEKSLDLFVSGQSHSSGHNSSGGWMP
jgi:hypothetical protein